MQRSARRRGSRWLALCRLLLLLGAGFALSSALLLSATRARAGDVLVELGAQIMRLPEARYANGVQQLSLNGLTLFMQSGSSERAPQQVVEDFYEACKQSAAPSVDTTLRHTAVRLAPKTWLERWLDGVVVQLSGDRTAIACIDAENRSQEPESVLTRLQSFFTSGELAELGRLRVAWVEPVAGGSAFLTLWTQGSVALLDRFPAAGDAPGFDLPDLERVAGSRRLLSASLETSALTLYEHRVDPFERILERYRAALERAGYRASLTPPTASRVFAQVFTRRGRTLVLCVQSGEAEATFVSLLAPA